jgi:RND superfamily putative drug exporter
MSLALYRLGRGAYRHARLTLTAALLLLVALAAAAGLLGGQTSESYTVPGTSSQQALDALAIRFPEVSASSADIIVVAPEGQRVTDPEVKQQIEAFEKDLVQLDHVTAVMDPFSGMVNGAVTDDGRAALVTAQLDLRTPEVTEETRQAIYDAGAPLRDAGLTVEAGGAAYSVTPPELSITEAFGLVIALLVLIGVFRSFLAALPPILTAVYGAIATVMLVMIAASMTDVPGTSLLLAIMIGLAVGIDYALFVLTRYRELLAEGVDPEEAAGRSLGTAGSAVVFAGVTVMIALSALSVVGLPFLTAMGFSAAAGVVVAVATTLTVLPASMAVLGPRIRPATRRAQAKAGLWDRWVTVATWKPVATLLLVIIALGALAIPATSLRFALTDGGNAATETTQRKAYDLTEHYFGPGENGRLLVAVDLIASRDPLGDIDKIRQDLADEPGVERVAIATPNPTGDYGIVVLVPTTGPKEQATQDLVTRLRDKTTELSQQYGYDVSVTGQTAVGLDVSDRLASALLPFGFVVVGLSLVLLAVVFRSIVVPLTASIGYLLSLGASFGVVSLVFQHGHLAGLLGVPRVGPVISFLPIILMGVLFGLAMDYQVFVASRMHEDYSHTRDPHGAVRRGFVGAAPVVAAAAAIMIGVFAAFVPEGDATIKPIALSLAVGVAADAFLVRMLAVPAVLSLLGHVSWAFPRWLDERLPDLDVEGSGLRRQLETERPSEQVPHRVVTGTGLTVAGPRGPVFADVDLTVDEGTVTAVTGGPGSGKTALLLAVAGRLPLTDGFLEVAGGLLPEERGHVQRAVELAELPGINDLDLDLDVDHHLAERLAARSLHPWAGRRELTRARAAYDELLAAARREAPEALPTADPDGDTLVADLTDLQRRLLGLALAALPEPAVVVVDDVSALHTTAEQRAFWAACSRVSDRPSAHGDRRTAVIAASADATPLDGLTTPARRGATLSLQSQQVTR